MDGSLARVVALLVCICLETSEQLAFALSGRRKSVKNIWTVTGCTLHVVALASWLWLLAIFPLGIALPLTGLNYVAVTLAGRYVLGERLDAARWLGVSIIVSGLAVIFVTQGVSGETPAAQRISNECAQPLAPRELFDDEVCSKVLP